MAEFQTKNPLPEARIYKEADNAYFDHITRDLITILYNDDYELVLEAFRELAPDYNFRGVKPNAQTIKSWTAGKGPVAVRDVWPQIFKATLSDEAYHQYVRVMNQYIDNDTTSIRYILKKEVPDLVSFIEREFPSVEAQKLSREQKQTGMKILPSAAAVVPDVPTPTEPATTRELPISTETTHAVEQPVAATVEPSVSSGAVPIDPPIEEIHATLPITKQPVTPKAPESPTAPVPSSHVAKVSGTRPPGRHSPSSPVITHHRTAHGKRDSYVVKVSPIVTKNHTSLEGRHLAVPHQNVEFDAIAVKERLDRFAATCLGKNRKGEPNYFPKIQDAMGELDNIVNYFADQQPQFPGDTANNIDHPISVAAANARAQLSAFVETLDYYYAGDHPDGQENRNLFLILTPADGENILRNAAKVLDVWAAHVSKDGIDVNDFQKYVTNSYAANEEKITKQEKWVKSIATINATVTEAANAYVTCKPDEVAAFLYQHYDYTWDEAAAQKRDAGEGDELTEQAKWLQRTGNNNPATPTNRQRDRASQKPSDRDSRNFDR